MTISVFGLGKLGSPLAAWFASASHTVYCIDKNQSFLEKIGIGVAPVKETGLQKLINDNLIRMIPVGFDDSSNAVADSEFVFVIVPTPSLASSHFSNEFILDSFIPISKALSDGAHPHVVIVCTTSPGSCEDILIPALQDASGRCAGIDFGFSYNPEFIALGSVIENMNHPDFILIGSVQPRWAVHLKEFYEGIYAKIGNAMPPVCSMSLINAEIAKLSLNCYCTTKISFANQIARLCEKIPGADAKVVCNTIGNDRRVGKRYLSPGGTYSGPCFPRDCLAMIATAEKYGTDVPLARATESVNAQVVYRLMSEIKECQNVAILGASYKTDTSVTEESLATKILSLIGQQSVKLHDPEARLQIGNSIQAKTVQEAVSDADCVIIATAWPEYKFLTQKWLKSKCKVIDCWGVLDDSQFKNCRYIRIGKHLP